MIEGSFWTDDLKAIDLLVKDGRYSTFCILSDVYAENREVSINKASIYEGVQPDTEMEAEVLC